jgi:hypothetical protein
MAMIGFWLWEFKEPFLELVKRSVHFIINYKSIYPW